MIDSVYFQRMIIIQHYAVIFISDDVRALREITIGYVQVAFLNMNRNGRRKEREEGGGERERERKKTQSERLVRERAKRLVSF